MRETLPRITVLVQTTNRTNENTEASFCATRNGPLRLKTRKPYWIYTMTSVLRFGGIETKFQEDESLSSFSFSPSAPPEIYITQRMIFSEGVGRVEEQEERPSQGLNAWTNN